MRSFTVGSEAEGCVADDDTGALYISEENEALWRYAAEPEEATAREAVDVLTGAGGHLVNDVEGVTLVDQADGAGYIIVSVAERAQPQRVVLQRLQAQPGQRFREDLPGRERHLLGRLRPHRRHHGVDREPRARPSRTASSSARTTTTTYRGRRQPGPEARRAREGREPRRWRRGTAATAADRPVAHHLRRAGRPATANNTTFDRRVPASVGRGRRDAAVRLHGQQTALTGPGTGWTQVSRVVDTGHATTVWRRAATGRMPAATVRLTTSGGVYTKAAVTLAAYRGVDPLNDRSSRSRVRRSREARPRTPRLWWRTRRRAPGGCPTGRTRTVRRRAGPRRTTRPFVPPPTGSGGGRVGTLLTDPGASLTAGTPATTGGLTATANAGATRRRMWTDPAAPGRLTCRRSTSRRSLGSPRAVTS